MQHFQFAIARLRSFDRVSLLQLRRYNVSFGRVICPNKSLLDFKYCSRSKSDGNSLLNLASASPSSLDITDISTTTLTSFPHLSVAENSTFVIEPALSTLGLAGWQYPSGWVQSILEQLHITVGLPWWGSIIVYTVAIRTLLFPVLILGQRNAIRMGNIMPEVKRLQGLMMAAMMEKNYLDNEKYKNQLDYTMRKAGVSQKNMLVPMLIQGPVFIMSFFGLKGMANLPVPSMTEGGLAWFTNLTVYDPYFVLPALTASSLFLVLKLGTDINTDMMPPIARQFMLYCMPLGSFVFMCSFPSCLTLYWFVNNIISSSQGLTIRKFGRAFGMPERIVHTVTISKPQVNVMDMAKEIYKTSQIRAADLNRKAAIANSSKQTANKPHATRTYADKAVKRSTLNPLNQPIKRNSAGSRGEDVIGKDK